MNGLRLREQEREFLPGCSTRLDPLKRRGRGGRFIPNLHTGRLDG